MNTAARSPAVAVISPQFCAGDSVELTIVRKIMFTFQKKFMSARRRWKVFIGESRDANNMLFSVLKSTLLQMKTKLDVFLASNTAEEVADFWIEGSWFENSCVIYAGGEANPDKIIAQMHRNHSVKSVLLGKDSFAVTVYPNIDYAFAVSLILLLEEINEGRKNY